MSFKAVNITVVVVDINVIIISEAKTPLTYLQIEHMTLNQKGNERIISSI